MTDRELLECLKDRSCDACKFHSDKGCSKWDCVFDSKKALEQEPCDNAVSRQAAIDAFQMFREYESNRNNKEWVDRIETVLNQLPPVNPQPKTGHWIDRTSGYAFNDKCSECGYIVHIQFINEYKYCPNCGAKMVEPQESEGV